MLPRAASTTSPWLTCNVLAPGLQDPEEYAHLSVLRNLKRYVARSDPEQQTVLYSRISNHSGQFLKIHGPAGVIKRTLQRFNWSMDESGNIVTNTMIRFQLAKTRLCEFMRDSWMMFVSTQVVHWATSTAFGRWKSAYSALQRCRFVVVTPLQPGLPSGSQMRMEPVRCVDNLPMQGTLHCMSGARGRT